MKTAMQELIDDLSEMIKNSANIDQSIGLNAAQNKARKQLEKEKQQIVDSYSAGYTTWDENNQCQKEAYYTKTFTQREGYSVNQKK